MTVLNFFTSEKTVFIATDSSFSHADDKHPAGYITKAFLLPHLDGIIAGTGDPRFIADWLVRANTGFVVRNMIHLDQFTQQSLAEIYRYRSIGEGNLGTTTIYQWGYDPEIGVMRSFAYRSKNGFISEELGFGSALKPGYDIGDYEIRDFPKDFIDVVERQKAVDEALPVDQRVGVGGHVIAYWMQATDEPSGTKVTMSAQRVAELSGFEHGYQTACARL
jgi:hypothetical protein